MERKNAQPNKWTFSIPPIKALLSEEMNGCLWCDPFAGLKSPAQVKNDLNPEANAEFHMDALEFLKLQPTAYFDGVLYDPPYSSRQASECYQSFGLEHLTANVTNVGYWARCKDEIARILKLDGKAICFGWTSMGVSMSRGFELQRVLLVAHGGSRNDTICTVERKLQNVLFNTAPVVELDRRLPRHLIEKAYDGGTVTEEPATEAATSVDSESAAA